jgi:hypothetical protein
MKDIDRLKSDGEIQESGESYVTYSNIASIGIVLTADGTENTGILIEPMDFAPIVIEIGPVEELKALGKYILEVADKLE